MIFFSREFDPRFAFIMAVILGYLVLVLYIHFCSIPDSMALMEPPKDLKPAMYSLVNMCALLVGALAYGKPYSPFVIFFCGYLISVLVAIRYKGSLDWSERLVTIVALILSKKIGVIVNHKRFQRRSRTIKGSRKKF
jgi:hypothetical protein